MPDQLWTIVCQRCGRGFILTTIDYAQERALRRLDMRRPAPLVTCAAAVPAGFNRRESSDG